MKTKKRPKSLDELIRRQQIIAAVWLSAQLIVPVMYALLS